MRLAYTEALLLALCIEHWPNNSTNNSTKCILFLCHYVSCQVPIYTYLHRSLTAQNISFQYLVSLPLPPPSLSFSAHNFCIDLTVCAFFSLLPVYMMTCRPSSTNCSLGRGVKPSWRGGECKTLFANMFTWTLRGQNFIMAERNS